MKGIGQVLKEGGQRQTKQRALLWGLLREAGGHLDAEELYRMGKEKFPRLSLSTVYRTLRLFKGLGLVEELHFKEEHHHYEGKAPREHYHLLCRACGNITEFMSPLIPRLKAEVGKEKGFSIEGAEVHLTGLCPTCQKEQC